MILIVTHDLKGPAGSYTPFFTALQNQGPWWHYMSSMWLISTGQSPQQLAETLTPMIQQGDWIFVTPLSGATWGWLPKDAWDWINQHR